MDFQQISPAPSAPSSPAPKAAGVYIPTSSFTVQEAFQTSPDELYITFIQQEVPKQPQLAQMKAAVTLAAFLLCRVLEYLGNRLSLQLVQAFTRSAAMVDGRRGGRFQLLEGNISGCFTQLVSLQPSGWSRVRVRVSDPGVCLMLLNVHIFASRLKPSQKDFFFFFNNIKGMCHLCVSFGDHFIFYFIILSLSFSLLPW